MRSIEISTVSLIVLRANQQYRGNIFKTSNRLFETHNKSRIPTSLPFSTSPTQEEHSKNRLFPEELNIIYDSKCNVCKLEIDFLAKRDSTKINKGAPKLKMTDLESSIYDEKDPRNGGVSYEKGMASIHAVTCDGKVISGVPVFALAYEQVRLGWLFKFTTWPVLKHVVEFGYKIFARYRTNLTRGESVDALVKQYEERKMLKEKMEEEAKECETCVSKQ